MGSLKKLLWLAVLTAIIITLGKLIPQGLTKVDTLKRNFAVESDSLEPAADSSPTEPEEPDTPLPIGSGKWRAELIDSLSHKFGLQKNEVRSSDEDFCSLFFPRGQSLVVYTLEIWKMGTTMGVESQNGWIAKSNIPTYEVKMEKSGHTLTLRIRHSNRYLAGHAKLAIVLAQSGPKEQDLKPLQAHQNWPLTVIINPFPAKHELSSVSLPPQIEIMARLPLEPYEYPYQNPGQGTLLIHHSEAEIKKRLGEIERALPGAKSLATYFGSRAVENQKFMQTLVKNLAQQKTGLLDITGSARSYSLSACRESDLLCRKGRIMDSEDLTPAFLQAKIRSCLRYGESLIIAEYSAKVLQQMEDFFHKNPPENLGIEIVGFSRLMNY